MPIESRKEWIKVAGCAAAAAAFVGVLIALLVHIPWPTCKPGDGALMIGGSMLLAGCPEKRR